MMALTATATPSVQKDIQDNLGFRPGMSDRYESDLRACGGKKSASLAGCMALINVKQCYFKTLKDMSTTRGFTTLLKRLTYIACRWTQSFERQNLNFKVRLKESDVLRNFQELTDAHASGKSLPTIIYTITRK